MNPRSRAVLLVDNRAGSKELIKPLTKALGSLNVEATILPFGDVAFVGKGLEGAPIDIGLEFKSLSDILACCRDGRFAGHKMPGMRRTYAYSWLLIEGLWRTENGLITTYQGPKRGWRAHPSRMKGSEFEKHLLTFELCGGMHVHLSNTRSDTLNFILNLYRWWTDSALDAHTSHLAVHTPATLGEVSPFRRAVMAWPGLGQKVSKSVEEEFSGQIRAAA